MRNNFQSDDEAYRFWSAWSAVLLGDRATMKPPMAFVNFATRYREPALRLQDGPTAQNWLKGLLQDQEHQRYVLMGTGITGDPVYIPTLIGQMAVPELARVAGEAFSLIAGVDLAYQDPDGDWPDGFEAGPNENPDVRNPGPWFTPAAPAGKRLVDATPLYRNCAGPVVGDLSGAVYA